MLVASASKFDFGFWRFDFDADDAADDDLCHILRRETVRAARRICRQM